MRRMQWPFSRRSLAWVMLTPLSGCCTIQLWDLPQRTHTSTTSRCVQPICASLLGDANGIALQVCLPTETTLPCTYLLRPRRTFALLLWDALHDTTVERTLHIRHDTRPERGALEWDASLHAGDGDGMEVEIPLSVSRVAAASPSPGALAVDLHRIVCTEVTHPPYVDAWDVAWRVPVTPFAVAADVVLVVPLGITLGILALTNPGLLNGG